MVFTTELSWPSLDDWDLDRLYRKKLRYVSERHISYFRHSERSLVGWSIHSPLFGLTPGLATRRFRVLVNLFHLLVYPFYVLRIILDDVVAPIYHTVVFPGAFFLVRELFGLPNRRRLLQRYFKKGTIVEGLVYNYLSKRRSKRIYRLVKFTLPAKRKDGKDLEEQKHRQWMSVDYAFAVGNVPSLYKRESPVQPGETIDLLCFSESEDAVTFFTYESWEVEIQKAKYDRQRSIQSLLIGSLSFPLGSLVFTLFVFLPGVMLLLLPMYATIKDFRFQVDDKWEQYVAGQEQAQNFFHRLVIAAWLSLMVIDLVNTSCKLCYFHNWAEYYAEKKDQEEQTYG